MSMSIQILSSPSFFYLKKKTHFVFAAARTCQATVGFFRQFTLTSCSFRVISMLGQQEKVQMFGATLPLSNQHGSLVHLPVKSSVVFRDVLAPS